jgi:GxxExxY protein
MIHKDKTGLLIGGLFDVHNEVRQGRDEPDYHEAFKAWLEEERIPFMNKPLHELRLHGQVAHRMYPDFVAWDLIVIELKAKARDIRFGEFAQLFNYLKCRGGPLGLMANMGLDRVIHERVVFDPEKGW